MKGRDNTLLFCCCVQANVLVCLFFSDNTRGWEEETRLGLLWSVVVVLFLFLYVVVVVILRLEELCLMPLC